MITNRTQYDVDTAINIREQKIKKFLTLSSTDIVSLERGMMTYNTINRIENKQAELANLLNSFGYWNNIVNKTWQLGDNFNEEDFQRIIDNISTLRSAYCTYYDTPATPQISYHFEDINSIEKILYDIETLIDKMKNSFIYSSSDIYSGGV